MCNENKDVVSLELFDAKTGKPVLDGKMSSENAEKVREIIANATAEMLADEEADDCVCCEVFDGCEDEGYVPIEGTTITGDRDELAIFYLDKNNEIIGRQTIMPDIVNVQNPNATTVFVEFSDGSKEVAHLNEGDTFNLETGVLICIMKKMFSDMGFGATGSSVYNRVIKYALSKVDATKKMREAEIAREKARKVREAEQARKEKIKANREREETIRLIGEAVKRALNETQDEAEVKFKNSLDELVKTIGELEDKE